jgi:DNA adenine methylase
VTRAVGFVVRHQFSRGGLGRSFAWSVRPRGGNPGDANGWRTKLEKHLDLVAERLRGVRLVVADGREAILHVTSAKTLFYCDPPYLPETRSVRKAYRHEMTAEDHADLLAVLLSVRGQVVLSGYHSPLYDEALKDWELVEDERKNDAGQGKIKQTRVECLWINRRAQGVLFR